MPKTRPTDAVADALREVALALEQAIAGGHRSRHIDADDLVETLLAIADRLDPPTPTTTPSACPRCGEADLDALVWIDDARVRCATCGHAFQPHRTASHDMEK